MSEHVTASLPVRLLPGDKLDGEGPKSGLALCLSGGGYRAMLFHLGSLWRLHELELLPKLDRLSSVSGGSITAGVLGMHWHRLRPGREAFETLIVAPLRSLASRTVDRDAIVGGILSPGAISDKITAAYDRHLFFGATLQGLPDRPRFVLNATNVKTGALWRFSKPYMGDYRVGLSHHPNVPLAVAVAASSAFPPVLSPLTLELDPNSFAKTEGADLTDAAYRTEAVLTDGGVYDNLGLETAFKRCRTILVSDAGQKLAPEPDPKHDWGRHALRVNEVIDNQVRSLRKRQLIEAYQRTDAFRRSGAYWGIRSHVADYPVPDVLRCKSADTMALAMLKTRLKRLDELTQERLINWGYGVCELSLRAHFDLELQAQYEIGIEPATAVPYPEAWP